MDTITVKLATIVKDDDIYPRSTVSQKTIDAYIEALKGGATFPPIEVQRITDNKTESTIVLDGWHRVEAYRGYNAWLKQTKLQPTLDSDPVHGTPITEVEAYYWQEQVLDKHDNLKALRIEAITQNLRHGERLSNKDKQEMCRTMATDDADITITEDEFAQIFGVTQKTINNWITDIRARQRGTRANLIFRLARLGWTHDEIAEVVELTQPAVSSIIKNSNFTEIYEAFKQGKSPESLAEFYGFDMQMVAVALLDGETDDVKRLEFLGYENTRPYNLWNFQKDEKYGVKHAGNIPAGLLFQLLYFYTQQGDLIIDPMAGGGVTGDVCLVMNRKCRMYDIKSTRPEIQEHDLTTGLPARMKNADLVFLDPPYYKKKEKEYGEDAISALDRDDYLRFFKTLATQLYEAEVKRVAFLMSDWIDEDDPTGCLFIWDYLPLFTEAGWMPIQHIFAPLSSEQIHPDIINKFRKARRLGKLTRSLIIFERR